jgi:hypothetical protein
MRACTTSFHEPSAWPSRHASPVSQPPIHAATYAATRSRLPPSATAKGPVNQPVVGEGNLLLLARLREFDPVKGHFRLGEDR